MYFDDSGRNYKIVDEKGNVVEYTFDGTSTRITRITERFTNEYSGRSVDLTYDTSGNFVTSETDELNNSTSFNYDANGNLLDTTDASNKKISFTYDPFDRILNATLEAPTTAENIQVTYDYDTEGNLTSRIDPRGYTTSFAYNAINKSTTETDPLGKFIQYDYDENGNLKLTKKGKNTNIVSTQEFGYDNKNRLSVVTGSSVYVNTYDRADNLTKITLADTSYYSFTYDANNRLLSAIEPSGYRLTNTYNNDTHSIDNGLRTKYEEYVNSATDSTIFAYDPLHRVKKITGPKGGVTEYFYNENGNKSRISSGATNIHQDYDDTGKLIAQTVLGTSMLGLKYTYNANDQVNTYYDGTKTNTYTYDFAKRLTSWNDGTNTVNYNYDKSGNLLNPHGKSLTFNSGNEIESFLYDDAGNLTQDDKYKYLWNQEGELTEVQTLTGSTIETYTYRPDGLRKSKTLGSTTYYYHYDGSNLIRVTNNTGATVWSFTWDGGKPISMTNSSGTNYYYVTNYHGDVVRIVDATCNTVASYSYDPWGKVISANEDTAVANQPLRYAGYVYDTETQLYYLQARYYDAETSRFISRDPDGGDKDSPLTQNLYSYCNGDPVNNVDPDGKFAFLLPLVYYAVVSIYFCTVYYYARKTAWDLYCFSKKAKDAGKGEAHGDNGRTLKKAQKQIEKLMEELKTATGKAAKQIRQKIKNIQKEAEKANKGETHWRR